MVAERVNVVSVYSQRIHSPSAEMSLPSVISLKEYIPTSRRPAFTRFNVFLRDSFSCQYCGESLPTHDLTFDHVIPRSRGGRTTWENVVAACGQCNHVKGSRTPREAGMPLLQEPHRPTKTELNRRAPDLRYRDYHHSWLDYLYWDSELDD